MAGRYRFALSRRVGHFCAAIPAGLRSGQGLSNLGIGPGDHVATLIGGRPEWFYLSYAISLLGAVIVPINITFRRHELEHVMICADV